MYRYSLLLHNQQIKDLKRLSKDTSVSEIIRSLITDFIEKKKREELNVSKSLSKKGGEIYE